MCEEIAEAFYGAHTKSECVGLLSRPMADVTRAAAVIVGLGSEAVNRSRR